MKLYKIPINYGTIAGLLYFILFIAIYYAGGNPLGKYSYFGAWIPIVFIYLGIKNHRDKELGGFINFVKALGAGMFITFAFASLFNMLVYSFGTFVAPNLVDRQMSEFVEQLDEMQKSIDQMKAMGNESFVQSLQLLYDKAADELEKHPESFTLGSFTWNDFQTKLAGGFFVSLIMALILKRKEPLFSEQLNV